MILRAFWVLAADLKFGGVSSPSKLTGCCFEGRMNYPAAPISGIAASLRQAAGYPAENYSHPKGRGIKPSPAKGGLNVVVEIKLVRMGPQLDIVDFVFGLVVNPHVDGIAGEDIASEEKFLIGLQSLQGLIQ